MIDSLRPAGKNYWSSIFFALACIFGAIFAIDPGLGVKLALPVVFFVSVYCIYLLPKNEVYSGNVFNWVLGFYLLCAIVWPKYAVLKIGTLPSISPGKLAFATLIIFWVYGVLRYFQLRQNLMDNIKNCRMLFAGWVFYVFFRAASFFLLNDVPFFILLKFAVEEVFGYQFVLIAALTFIRSGDDVRFVARFFYLAILLVIFVAIIEQYKGETPFAAFVNLDADTSGRLAEALMPKIRDGSHRLQSSFEHPLVLGQFLVMLLPVCFLSIFQQGASVANRVALIFLVILSYALLWKTGARSSLAIAVATFGAILVVMPILEGADSNNIAFILRSMFAVVAAVMVGWLLGDFIVDIISAKTAQTALSSSARIYMLAKGIPLIFDSPFIGYGPGEAPFLAGVLVTGGLMSIDNFYLSVALDSGLGALIGFVLMVISALWYALRFFTNSISLANRKLGFAMVSGIIGFSVTLSVLSIISNFFIFSVMAASVGVLSKENIQS